MTLQEQHANQKQRGGWVGKVFVLLVLAALAAGLIRTAFFPQPLNQYENRYAAQMPAPTAAGILDGSFQDGVDAALMDQIPLAQSMKRGYHQTKTRYLVGALDGVTQWAGLDRDRYVSFQGLCLYGDGYIVNWTRPLATNQEALDRKAAVLNQTFANHPSLRFYTYYIEKDTDLNFQTGEKSGLSQAILSQLALPEARKGVYTIDSFEEFSTKFYRTDTHWNCVGSYEAYRQLVDLLGCQGAPLVPAGDAVLVGEDFSGVKASTVGASGVLTESFYGYPYQFPAMTVTVNGAPAEDYGNQTAFLEGTATLPLTYGNYYGGDNGETIFNTGTQGRGKLLVIGESYDNAVLKLLASHYDSLYSVDLRYYEHSMGQPFDLTSYTQANGITDVLLMGNIDYFIQDTFDPEA